MVAAPTVPVNANDEEFKDSSVKSYARLRPRLSGTENGKTWIEDPVELEFTRDKIMNKGRIGSSSSCNKVQTLRFFNRVFGPDMNNEEIFHEMVVPMLNNVVKGFPSVMIAYGQTGSGKTYSMLGVGEKSGMGLLNFSTKWLRQRSDNQSITLSAVEVYGIHGTRVSFYDLFKQPLEWTDKIPLKALGMASTMELNSDEECKEAILKAHASSHFAPTARNPQSSRGHICFKVTYTKGRKESSFVIVDLAGSEGMSDLKKPTKGSFDCDSDDQPTQCSFETRKMEAGIIKNGLGELRGMITELKRRKLGKARGTGLRQLLFEHVTGNTILSFLFTIAPSKMHSTATENTLRVADSVSQIKKKVTRIADKGPKSSKARRLSAQENDWLRKSVELRDIQLMKQKTEIEELKKRLHHIYYLAFLAGSKQRSPLPMSEGEEGAPHPLQAKVERMQRELDEKDRQIQSYKAEIKDMVDRHSEEKFLVDSMVSLLTRDLKKKMVDIEMLRKVDQGYRRSADAQFNELRVLVSEGDKTDVEYTPTPTPDTVDSVGSETDPEYNSSDLANLAGLRNEALKCLTMSWPVTSEGRTAGCSPTPDSFFCDT